MSYRCPGIDCYSITEKPDWLCDNCWSYRFVILGKLPAMWVAVEKAKIPQSRPGQRITGPTGFTSRTPIRDGVLDAAESTLATVHKWADVVRDRHKMSPMPAIRSARSDWLLGQAVDTLSHLDGCLAQSLVGVDYYSELYHVVCRRLARYLNPSTEESEHIRQPCPACESLTLCARAHRRYVVCLTCGSRWGHAAWYGTSAA